MAAEAYIWYFEHGHEPSDAAYGDDRWLR